MSGSQYSAPQPGGEIIFFGPTSKASKVRFLGWPEAPPEAPHLRRATSTERIAISDNYSNFVIKQKRNNMNTNQDNEILDESFELMADEIGVDDTKVMGVYGAMARGLSKEEALKKYDLSEKEYDDNVDRVLNG